MMKRYSVLTFLLLLLSAKAEAATLFGRVIEINDGDVITVFNLNRPVRIRLLAVDAPEVGQEFAEVAKKHLSDLVYDKSVLVEYWGIAADGSLVGRVMLNTTDVGAQMIRDGVAWFDPSNQARLSSGDRAVYQQSEQVARVERRGLWQSENPVAPWEFVRAQALKKNPAASLNSILPATKVARDRPTPELTNLTLLGARTPAASTIDADDPSMAWAAGLTRKNWQQLKPEGEDFSALVPEDGLQKSIAVPFAGEMWDVSVYAARDGWAIYVLMWVTGPHADETDKEALNSTVRSFLKGFAEGYVTRNGGTFSCEIQSAKRLSVGGYTGTEAYLPDCTIPAKVRAFTRALGDRRQMYLGVVFHAEEDPNVSRFFESFIVGNGAPRSKPPAKKTRK